MAPMANDRTTDSPAAERSDTLRDISERTANLGKAVKDNLGEAASDAASALRQKGARLAEGAQDLASDVKDRFQDRIDEQKDAGADYVARIADAMRRAAHEFQQDLPLAAKYIEFAASGVDEYGERFRNGDLQDLVEGTKTFARRQPTAFLGLTFLAGFGLVRFLKSSSGAGGASTTDSFSETNRDAARGERSTYR